MADLSRPPSRQFLSSIPNFGVARGALLPCAKVDMVRRLDRACAPPVSDRHDWLADLCATRGSGPQRRWSALGDLASAAARDRRRGSPSTHRGSVASLRQLARPQASRNQAARFQGASAASAL